MTDKEKKIIFTIVAILVIILIIVLIVKAFSGTETNANVTNTGGNNIDVQNEEQYVTELENGTKLNNSADLSTTKTFGQLEISNIQFTSQNGDSVLLADVKNNGSTVHEAEIVKITVLGENNEVLAELEPVLPTIQPGETAQLNAIATADIVNAKDFTIEAK
mgnify:CR=1 FL=1